jgi:hypothetical protein
MICVSVQNRQFLTLLDDYIVWFKQHYISDLPCTIRIESNNGMKYYCSNEYLQRVTSTEMQHSGTPEFVSICSLQKTFGIPKLIRDKSNEISSNLCFFLGAKYVATHIYYPPSGFISWHTNWDCPGYALLLSYSEKEGGFFKYIEKGNIITILDEPGWTIKSGYFGTKGDRELWHCAGSTMPRHSFGFVFSNKYMLDMALQDLVITD